MACGGCAAERGLEGDRDDVLAGQVVAFLREHDRCATVLRLNPARVPRQRRPTA